MKKIYFMLITLFMVCSMAFLSCSDDDNGGGANDRSEISYGDLPVQSQNLISDYFDGYEVRYAYKTIENYGVTLNKSTKASMVSGYEITFDAKGDWVEIEAHQNVALPDNVLTLMNNHRTILVYINREYPDRGINEIEKEGTTTYTLELTGTPELKLIFSSLTGEYLGLESDNDKEQIININELPAEAQSFLSAHFLGLAPTSVKKDGDSYEVMYPGKTEVEFYLSGEWKEIEVEDSAEIPDSVIDILPAAIKVYIQTNHAGNKIEKIENKINCFEIELSGLKDELIFDRQGYLITGSGSGNPSDNERVIYENLPSNIREFLNAHFSAEFMIAKKDKDEYEVVLKNGTEIEFDLSGNLKTIEVIPNKGYSVPESVMPNGINSYVKTNYPNRVVEEFEIKTNKNYTYKIELSGYPEIELLFDANGNFLRLD